MVDAAVGHFAERAAFLEQPARQLILVGDQSDGSQRIGSEFRPDDEGLRRFVIDGSDAEAAVHSLVIFKKPGFELRLADAVNGVAESVVPINCESRIFGSEMGVIIRPIKKGLGTIPFRYNTEDSTHLFHLFGNSFVRRIKRSMVFPCRICIFPASSD